MCIRDRYNIYRGLNMKKRYLNNFAIVGAGMVGTAIGYLLKKAGYEIVAIADKSAAALRRAQSYTGGKAYRKPQEILHEADCILITTPDDIILSVCKDIALCLLYTSPSPRD